MQRRRVRGCLGKNPSAVGEAPFAFNRPLGPTPLGRFQSPRVTWKALGAVFVGQIARQYTVPLTVSKEVTDAIQASATHSD